MYTPNRTTNENEPLTVHWPSIANETEWDAPLPQEATGQDTKQNGPKYKRSIGLFVFRNIFLKMKQSFLSKKWLLQLKHPHVEFFL